MIGVLVVTHGNFSESIIKSMELIFGHHDKLEALTLNHGDECAGTIAQGKREI